MIDLQRIEKNVIGLCQEVGEFIHTESLQFDKSRIEQKDGFNNLVSYVDKESEKKIIAVLEKLVPGAGFLGEEGTDKKGSNEYRWIIDPLDGTTNFMHALPVFAISIALAKNDKVILGAVHEVNRKECFHAIENNAAFCNDREIHVSPAQDLSQGLMATGFPYFTFDKMDSYLNIIRAFLDKSHGIRRLGSAATDLAYVACGRLEGFFEYNLNSWDVAAGTFIVQQAGGVVSDFKGGNNYIFGGELCAGTKTIHPEMLEIIKREWNK